MPVLQVFEVNGLTLKFNSLDHMEPHFHAIKRGAWELRIFFLTCTDDFLDMQYKRPRKPARNFEGITRAERRELLEKVVTNRAQLLIEWEAKVIVMENFDAST